MMSDVTSCIEAKEEQWKEEYYFMVKQVERILLEMHHNPSFWVFIYIFIQTDTCIKDEFQEFIQKQDFEHKRLDEVIIHLMKQNFLQNPQNTYILPIAKTLVLLFEEEKQLYTKDPDHPCKNPNCFITMFHPQGECSKTPHYIINTSKNGHGGLDFLIPVEYLKKTNASIDFFLY